MQDGHRGERSLSGDECHRYDFCLIGQRNLIVSYVLDRHCASSTTRRAFRSVEPRTVATMRAAAGYVRFRPGMELKSVASNSGWFDNTACVAWDSHYSQNYWLDVAAA
jgi:hypothetical protein